MWLSVYVLLLIFLQGLSFTNTSPFSLPTRASKPALGTNPITLAAPATNGDNFCLDMATTTVALGKVELAQRKEETIPRGWAADCNGQVSKERRK